MSDGMKISLPVPPSGNRIWDLSTRRIGGKSVPMMHHSGDAKRYIRATKLAILETCGAEISTMNVNAAYKLQFTFYLQALNKGWPDKAKTRFKDLDISNRVILLENCIKQVTGINDNHNFWLDVRKKQAWENQPEEVLVEMSPLSEEWWQE